MVSTVYFMLTEGLQAEGHPAVRLVSTVFGPVLGPIIGKICQFLVVIAVTVFLRRQAVYIFVAVIILYLWAAWYNVWGCHLYWPRLLELLQHLGI
jgi:tetrahydromethanopterin S-methyltransferase subunit D